jgi:methionyl-tRNA formyltransferase
MIDGFPAVATADGLLLLETVQPEGKGVMDGRSFARGAPSFIGTTLTANSMA